MASRVRQTPVAEAPAEPLDPVTQQIIGNALGAISDEMATTIFRTAHSTVVRDSMDFSACVCNAGGDQIAQAVSVPFHLGSIPTAMETLLNHYGDQFIPGDIYVMNDPFDGGMHIPDIFIVKPVFNREELIGFAATTAHHADVGGRLPGSAACDNTEIYQEGLRLPWLRLYAGGEPVEDIHKILRANVRIPRMTLGDVAAQVAACSVGERGLQELAERYGNDTLAASADALIEYSDRLIRQEIATWPDGKAEFVDYLDSDGIDVREVAIVVEITIEGDEVTADFTKSAPMVRGALNCTASTAKAAVYQAVRAALTVDVPSTAGAFRPISVITKPGTVTHVTMPGASSMRGVTGFRVVDAVNGALAQLVPDRVPAAGEGGNTLAIFSGGSSRDERFIYYELVCGTWGGNPTADGNDGLSNPCATAANVPVEVAEAEFPILIERYGLVADSGGAGEFRGGLAIERSWRCLDADTLIVIRSDRQHHAPYGLARGLPGGLSANLIMREDGTVETLPPMCTTALVEGETYYHRTAGGGGWGNPLFRKPDAVAADVIAGKISPEAALASYAVVVTVDGSIDADATTRLRAQRGAPAPARPQLEGPH